MARPRKYNYEAIYADYKKLKKKDRYPRDKRDIANKYNTSIQLVNNVIKSVERPKDHR